MLGSTVGVTAGAAAVAPVSATCRSIWVRPRTPRATSTAVASAAQPRVIQPRPGRRGARCAPTRARVSGARSKRSRGYSVMRRYRSAGRPVLEKVGATDGAGVPESLQTLHEHRVLLQGGRGVDQPPEQLVVARRRDAELLADRLLLHTAAAPPGPLEGEHREVARGERGAGRPVAGTADVVASHGPQSHPRNTRHPRSAAPGGNGRQAGVARPVTRVYEEESWPTR